jgi:hypothetical protein
MVNLMWIVNIAKIINDMKDKRLLLDLFHLIISNQLLFVYRSIVGDDSFPSLLLGEVKKIVHIPDVGIWHEQVLFIFYPLSLV